MVEALPCPCERIPDPNDADAMASACRIGFEHGADVLKTYATGSAESFRQVTASCPAPVLIAGGPKMDSERAVLQVVRDTLDAGGQGVVFGRNIWQSPEPARMIQALRHLIHDDGTVDEAARCCCAEAPAHGRAAALRASTPAPPGIRALVFTPEGRLVAEGSRPTPVERPRPGWAEHDPEALWQAACEALREATGQLDRPGADRRASRSASVGEAFVALDPAGRPTCPTDRLVRRAAARRARLARGGRSARAGCTR